MRRIAIVTFTRAEYSSLLPVLKALQRANDFELLLMVSGTHLSPEHGMTVQQIEMDGFPIAARVDMEITGDKPGDIVRSFGVASIGFSAALAQLKPDLILIVGDRLELLSIATAALAFQIPVAHISGGDITEGAIDNQVRDAVSRLSHLHFVAMPGHAERLKNMGEEPWRIHVTGDPALDFLKTVPLLSRKELEANLDLFLNPPVVVVTYHPVTLGGDAFKETQALLDALKTIQGTLIITGANADVGGNLINEQLRTFAHSQPNARFMMSLGQLRYYSLLAQADLMIGNSSSGIWESPSFRLPVVNVGDRQAGRYREGNVIDVSNQTEAISSGIKKGKSKRFRDSLQDLINPYGDGEAAERIVGLLRKTKLDGSLRQKRYPFPWKKSNPSIERT